jgi:protein-disulfide isomerase
MPKESPQDRTARLAKARADARAAERRRNLIIAGGVALVMALIIGAGVLVSSLGSDKPTDSAQASADAVSVTIGPDSAPHKVVIYEDFLCPYCGELERATHSELADLAEQGKVQVEYRPFNLLGRTATDYSQQSLEVFAAVVHGDTAEVAKSFHDALFADQPSEAGPFPSQDDIVATAVTAGATQSGIESALDSGDATTWANGATQAAKDAGVQGTPTVLLDGKEFAEGTTIDARAKALIDAVS